MKAFRGSLARQLNNHNHIHPNNLMKFKLITCTGLSLCLLMGSCNMNNTGKGALIGGGGGAALGAGLGAIIGGGKGAGIGSAIGAAVGAGAGALIGRKMDKQAQQLQEQLAQNAEVQTVEDQNGLKAIKVVFNSAILFPTNGTSLSKSAEADLSQFAASLRNNPGTDVEIDGYTDNTGSMEVNTRVANGRADAVRTYLIDSGIAASRLTAHGYPMTDYVASNETAAGRAQNRRVEIYITAGQEMIQQANDGTLQ